MGIALEPNQLKPTLRRHAKATLKAVQRGIIRGAFAGERVLVKATPVDQGEMRRAWHVRKTGRKNQPAVLINDAPYAGIIERGARPHKVGFAGWEQIYSWVYRHHAYFAATRTKKGRAKRMKKYVMEVTSQRSGAQAETGFDPVISAITWGIVKKIEKEGSRARFFVRDSIPELTVLTSQQVEKRLKRLAEKPPKSKTKKASESG